MLCVGGGSRLWVGRASGQTWFGRRCACDGLIRGICQERRLNGAVTAGRGLLARFAGTRQVIVRLSFAPPAFYPPRQVVSAGASWQVRSQHDELPAGAREPNHAEHFAARALTARAHHGLTPHAERRILCAQGGALSGFAHGDGCGRRG